MNFKHEINEAHHEYEEAFAALHDTEAALKELLRNARARHWEELRGSRSIEAQDRAMERHLVGNVHYDEIMEDLPGAQCRLELARNNLARVNAHLYFADISTREPTREEQVG